MAEGKGNLRTLEQAMRLQRKDTVTAFAKHVNPEHAAILKLANLDKRYVRASGTRLYDEDDNPYFDLTSGYGSLNLGHNHPEIWAAVHEAEKLPSVILAGISPLAGALAENLCELLPDGMEMTSFGSGGAEAVEIALRTSKAFTKRKKLLSCEKGYHGLSYGAMSVCGSGRYCDAHGSLMDGCERIPFDNLEALETKLKSRDFAGFIVEPIQGEGGAVAPSSGYLKTAEELCRKYGTLLILDEIQTGFGRTGDMFALEHEKVRPDIVTLSKSLGGGVVPISASITSQEIWRKAYGDRDRYDMVISTFGGNSAACAASLKVIEIMMRDRIPSKAKELGEHSRIRLEKIRADHDNVRSIRGRGLLLGIELSPPDVPGMNMEQNYAGMVITRLMNGHGILTSYYDLDQNVIRFEPPLVSDRSEIDTTLDSIDEVLGLSTARLTMSFAKSTISRKLGIG